jgi:DNA sulfur modification protein DndE
MNKMNRLLLMMCAILNFYHSSPAQWSGEVPFTMPEKLREPVFKTDTFNISNFGALYDGITLNTNAIASAIKTCSEAGGGVVVIPEGLWLTGPIELKSNINLHIKKGALVLFSRDFNQYPIIMSYYEGQQAFRCQSPLSATNAENIAISGEGVFDGSGDTWRMVKKSKLTSLQWKTLVSSGGIVSADKNIWYPTEKSKKGIELYEAGKLPPVTDKEAYENIKDFLRPVMVSLIRCKYVLLDGPTFQNSPSWCIHPLMCDHLTVRNLKVRNPWYAQNGDGIDIESCNIGSITNCTFDVGDDAICIKSGRDAEGRKRGMPTQNLIITDCIVYHGHGGFVIGSEMSGSVRNLFVSNCTFLGTDIGLRFKTTRGRGGIVENIYVSDISMINIPTDAIRFDMYYGGTSPVPEGDEKAPSPSNNKEVSFAVDEGTPQFRNFFIRNIRCNGALQAIYLEGLPEMAIANINIENASFKSVKGINVLQADQVTFKNITLEVENGDAIVLSNSRNMRIESFAVKTSGKTLKISGAKSENINCTRIGAILTTENTEISGEVPSKALIK